MKEKFDFSLYRTEVTTFFSFFYPSTFVVTLQLTDCVALTSLHRNLGTRTSMFALVELTFLAEKNPRKKSADIHPS
jgi:hypothetical protein